MTDQDERQGQPSASSYEALMLCPGRHALERTVKPERQSSKDAESGTLIHRAMEGQAVELSDEQRDLVERFRRQEAALVERFFSSEPVRIHREQRLWFELRFSGKPDAVYIGDIDTQAILVVDYKSGWRGVTAAPQNPQLRSLAVLAANHHRASEVFVSALQRSGEPTVAYYTPEDLRLAETELQYTLQRAERQSWLRIPGELQCRHCRAKHVCPEAQSSLQVVRDERALSTALTPERRAHLLDASAQASLAIKAIREEAKTFVAEGGVIPGWQLAPGTQREKIVNLQTVFERVFHLGCKPEEFTPTTTMTKKDFLAILRKLTGLKGKQLAEAESEVLDGCVETKTSAPSLKRVTGLEDSTEEEE